MDEMFGSEPAAHSKQRHSLKKGNYKHVIVRPFCSLLTQVISE